MKPFAPVGPGAKNHMHTIRYRTKRPHSSDAPGGSAATVPIAWEKAVFQAGLIRVGCAVLPGVLVLHQDACAQYRVSQRVTRPALVEVLQPTPVRDVLARNAIYGLVRGVPSRSVSFPERTLGDPIVYLNGFLASESQVCVELSLAQGGYRAHFRANVPKGEGTLAVPFDSADEVRTFMTHVSSTSAELAIKATPARRGECKANGPLLIGSWRRASESEPLYLAVGGFGMGQPAVRVEGQPLQYCESLARLLGRPDFGANVFGAYCPIKVTSTPCKTEIAVKVLWMEGNLVASEVPLLLRKDCSAP